METAKSHSRVFSAIASLLAVVSGGLVIFCVNASLGIQDLLPDSTVNAVNLGIPWVMLTAAALAIWRRLSVRITFPVLGCGISCLLYLGWDASAPPPLPQIPPILPASSKSVQAWQWMSKAGPGSRVLEILAESPDLPVVPPTFKAEEFAAFVIKNRRTFEEAWKSSLLGREWVETMAVSSPEGIFPISTDAGSMPSFPAIRSVVVIHWCQAQLQYADGRPDDAVRTLIMLVRACHNLQRGGASLLNQMIANGTIKSTHDLIERFVEDGRLSPAVRAELAGALQEAPTVSHCITMSFLGEEMDARAYVERVGGDSDLKPQGFSSADDLTLSANRVLAPFLFNPNQTLGDYVQFLRESRDLASKRELATLEPFAKQFEQRIERKRLKNPVGRTLQVMMRPAFNKVMESFWKEDDRRLALIRRLALTAKKVR